MELARFGVEEWLNSHEREAQYDIAGVSIESLSLEELFQLTATDSAAFFQDLAIKPQDYGWIEGSPAFKKSAAHLYRHLKADNILQTNGATGANWLVLYALIEPGDHVISLYPTYQQLYDIPSSLGAEVEFWPIKEELGWLPSLDDLRQMIRPNTKMICLNNANNPTGAVMDADYLRELAALARSCGAYILADEVYHSFGEEEPPAVADLYDKGISVNGLSKTYSLPGIRVGWIAAKKQLIERLKNYRDYTMISAGVFSDMVAVLALENRQQLLERNKKIVQTNLQILKDWVKHEKRASFIPPDWVSTAFVKLETKLPTEEFCLQLLRKYGVLVVPGSRFDLEGHVRIGYCCSAETLKEGLKRLSLCLSENEQS
ncbi:aminotransferase [Streptococcus sp. H49]|uniref:aminotransferase n=1 Tax=Streptococcus huangxiaojuni TaxID=3237239 RepID=UPI0034A4B017